MEQKQITIIEKMYITDAYLNKHPSWGVGASSWKAKQILKIINKNKIISPPSPPITICDIGCGAGEVLHQLFLQMGNYVSFVDIDISPYAIELCKPLQQKRLEYRIGSIFDNDMGFYDIIMANDVIEHIDDYYCFLRKMREKGKYKIFHVPLEISVLKVLFPSYIIKRRKESGHIQLFNKETALATLYDTGYKIIDYFITSSTVDLLGGTKERILHKLPRKIMYRISKDIAARIFGGCSLMILAE
jgi:SAM-dependent methyltransferase